jgi:hypothetical protein
MFWRHSIKHTRHMRFSNPKLFHFDCMRIKMVFNLPFSDLPFAILLPWKLRIRNLELILVLESGMKFYTDYMLHVVYTCSRVCHDIICGAISDVHVKSCHYNRQPDIHKHPRCQSDISWFSINERRRCIRFLLEI